MTQVLIEVKSPLANDMVICLTPSVFRGFSLMPSTLTIVGLMVMMSEPYSAFAITIVSNWVDQTLIIAFVPYAMAFLFIMASRSFLGSVIDNLLIWYWGFCSVSCVLSLLFADQVGVSL